MWEGDVGVWLIGGYVMAWALGWPTIVKGALAMMGAGQWVDDATTWAYGGLGKVSTW